MKRSFTNFAANNTVPKTKNIFVDTLIEDSVSNNIYNIHCLGGFVLLFAELGMPVCDDKLVFPRARKKGWCTVLEKGKFLSLCLQQI